MSSPRHFHSNARASFKCRKYSSLTSPIVLSGSNLRSMSPPSELVGGPTSAQGIQNLPKAVFGWHDVRKYCHTSRFLRNLQHHSPCHRDITQEKEVQTHNRRATKRWCRDERLKRNLAGHTIDQGRNSKVQRGAGVRMQGLKARVAGHMKNQMHSRSVFCYDHHAAGQNHPCQSPSQRKRP